MLSLNLNRFTTIYFISRILVPKVYQFTCVFFNHFFHFSAPSFWSKYDEQQQKKNTALSKLPKKLIRFQCLLNAHLVSTGFSAL